MLSPVGDQIACDGTVLTVSSGLVVGRIHEHELPSGRVRDIGNFVNRDVRAMDGEGTVYRLVGGIRHNFTTPDPPIGFFKININVVGPGGLFGKVKSTERRKPNGDEVFRDKGTATSSRTTRSSRKAEVVDYDEAIVDAHPSCGCASPLMGPT